MAERKMTLTVNTDYFRSLIYLPEMYDQIEPRTIYAIITKGSTGPYLDHILTVDATAFWKIEQDRNEQAGYLSTSYECAKHIKQIADGTEPDKLFQSLNNPDYFYPVDEILALLEVGTIDKNFGWAL